MRTILITGVALASAGFSAVTAIPKEASGLNTMPVEIRAEQANVGVADTFSVELAIGSPVRLRKVDIKISYDPNMLRCLSITTPCEEHLSEFAEVKKTINSKAGTLIYAAASRTAKESFHFDGTICSFTFLALRPGRANLVWRRFGVTADKGSGPGVPFSLKAASVVIAEEKETITELPLPDCFDLSQNFPNPFNPSTTIHYQIPEARYQMQDGPRPSTLVTVRIYNILGQEVRTLVDEVKGPGYHTILWDGRNNRGVEVSSGTYLCRMEAEGFTKVRRMTLLR